MALASQKNEKHNFDDDFFCGICTYLVYIEQAERREYTTVQSIVV